MPNNLEKSRRETARRPPSRPERARSVSYRGQAPSAWRRAVRAVFNVYTLSLATVAAIFLIVVAVYYWTEFSGRIDQRLLNGEVYTTGAGIYSGPKTLRKGEPTAVSELVAYLKSAGYVDSAAKADASRSRFTQNGSTLTVEPGASAVIDGKRMYRELEVRFRRDGKGVETIIDKDARKEVETVQLEPRILSSMAEEGDGRRKAVTFDDLPRHLVRAVVVTEDRAFFEHYGVNLRGIARALWRRYESDAEDSPLANQGGSSITQQLVKNLLLSNEQTLERKVKEAYMSLIVETRLTKEEIFTLYANQIYLGQQNGVSVYGVGEAAAVYFGKDVTQLTQEEAAFIAAIIRSPNRYNPFKYPEKALERRNQVLQSMTETGDIDQARADQMKKSPLGVKASGATGDQQGMPYFSQYVTEEVPKMVSDPEALQHLRVYTTIDPDLQRKAYEIVNRRLDKLDQRFPKQPKGNLNAALVALRPKTGEIVAMVGGRNFLENQFNRATSAERQPGSVFKPFVYAAGINSVYDLSSRVITAATMFKDEKKVFTFGKETYSPNNYGDTFSNKEMTVRDALVKSKNVITVDLAMELNIGKVMNLAAKAGYPKVEKAYPSMALGTAEATPLQVATAYTVFANLGDRAAPLPVGRITTGEGKTVVEPSADRKNVLRPDVAFIMNDIMKDVVNRGTAAGLKAWGFSNVEGKTAFAGKTGTSRDGWFAGFTPELVTVVYVGFDDSSDLRLTGAESAMPIWADFMKEALDLHPEWNGDWQMPDGLRKAEIDVRTGRLLRELDAPPLDGPTGTDGGTSPDPSVKGAPAAEQRPDYVRVEYFILSTLPLKEPGAGDEDPPAEPSETPDPRGSSEPPAEPQTEPSDPSPGNEPPGRTVSVMVCPLSGVRATARCPERAVKNFAAGSEPREFCQFHSR